MPRLLQPIAAKAEALRRERNWSRAQLAEEAGVDRVTVWALETERCVPHKATLTKIETALNAPGELLALRVRPLTGRERTARQRRRRNGHAHE